MKHVLLAAGLAVAMAAPAAAEGIHPRVGELYALCMGEPGSTEAFCSCGIGYYARVLSARDFGLLAALSDDMINRTGAFARAVDGLGLGPDTARAAVAAMQQASAGAAAVCEPLLEGREGR